jgi:uncharacterized membrane protein
MEDTMSKKNNRSIKETSSEKKAAILGEKNKKKGAGTYVTIGITALLVLVVAVFFFQKDGQSSEKLSDAKEMTFPVAIFDEGKAKHFDFAAGDGVVVKYFVLKSSDGVIRAAFDACDVCWPSGKGYYQDKDVMVCRNCGRRFASVKVNEVKGGCNPAPLNRTIVGDKLVIQASDILEGRRYFDFSKGGNS